MHQFTRQGKFMVNTTGSDTANNLLTKLYR